MLLTIAKHVESVKIGAGNVGASQLDLELKFKLQP
jgi:hypothetical protein